MGAGGGDVMPGQTTDKGYTATDTGIAINATLNTAEAFTDRDLEQAPDTSNATKLSLSSGQDITVFEEGVYLVSGSAENTTIIVEAPETAKVQLVLDGASITNDDFPAIYVLSADKCFVTTTDSENTLSVTGEFKADGDTNTDAVIFSKDDLAIVQGGSLTVHGNYNMAIHSKDSLMLESNITADAVGDGVKGKDEKEAETMIETLKKDVLPNA